MAALIGAAVALAAAFVAWVYLFGPWRNARMNAALKAPLSPVLGPFLNDPPVVDAPAWRTRRGLLLRALEHHAYGACPAPIEPNIVTKETIAPELVGGIEGVEQWRIDLGSAGHFHLALSVPPGDAPRPAILALNFSGNRAAFPGRPEAIAPPSLGIQWFCRYGFLDPGLSAIFGPHINGPPFAEVTARGYAVAMLYGGDIVPDLRGGARAALEAFAPEDTGALMAWAWTASRAYDALAADSRFDAKRVAVFGQSRQGKTALLAAAFDERFAAVIALQAGRGGDAPRDGMVGEPLPHMMRTFPHWYSPRFAEPGPADAHHLIALIAPRPLLVGHAKRDEWADPA
ncbi:MAG: hypothetical protein ACREH4_13920, partial [Vitreimonas sp.]